MLLIRAFQSSSPDASVLDPQYFHELPERVGAEDDPLVVVEQ